LTGFAAVGRSPNLTERNMGILRCAQDSDKNEQPQQQQQIDRGSDWIR
jgi:hypothetical protein